MTEKTTLKRFGDLVPGDVIRDGEGNVTVVEAYDEHIPESMYEITTDGGDTVKASGNHLWYIETSLDISLHRERRKSGKKLFGALPKKSIDKLVEIAEYDDVDDDLETALIDMVALLECDGQQEAIDSLVRVAESIGPVSENSQKAKDIYTNEDFLIGSVRHYDGIRFAQQILSLTGNRKFKKKWPLIVGRVVTTEQMLELIEDFEINIPDAPNATLRKKRN